MFCNASHCDHKKCVTYKYSPTDCKYITVELSPKHAIVHNLVHLKVFLGFSFKPIMPLAIWFAYCVEAVGAVLQEWSLIDALVSTSAYPNVGLPLSNSKLSSPSLKIKHDYDWEYP